MPEIVNCEHFQDLAVLYALGELEASACAAAEAHARVCPACAALLRREEALAAILSAEPHPASQSEPSDLLLTHCRNKLTHAIDQTAATARPSAWAGVFSLRDWIAAFRVSPQFHPAWSAAALLIVAAVSGLAGWEGIGRSPIQVLGPAMITVSAAPPASEVPAPTESSDGISGQAALPRSDYRSTEHAHLYSATDASTNSSFAPKSFEPSFAQEPLQSESSEILRTFASHAESNTPRHEPPLRMPSTLDLNAGWDAPARGSLNELSRRMETLWLGGVRIDPAEQQKRLVLGELPEYPEIARRAGIEGSVTLQLRIGRDGSVQDIELLSGEPVLGRAAAEAVEQWRYSPLRIAGQPASIFTTVTLDFQLSR